MKVNTLVWSLAGVLLFGGGVVTGLVAQTSSDSPQRVEQKRTDLAGAPGMEVIALVAEYKPGDSIGLHAQHGVGAAVSQRADVLPSILQPCRRTFSCSVSPRTHRMPRRSSPKRERGVLINAFGPPTVRAVTHLDVSRDQCTRAADILVELAGVSMA